MNKPDDYSHVIQQLRDSGHAVVIITPDELQGCPVDDIESSLMNMAWDEIEHIKSMIKENTHDVK